MPNPFLTHVLRACVPLCLAAASAGGAEAPPLPYIHGAQYFPPSGTTPEQVDAQLSTMARDDHINAIRLPLWGLYVGHPIDFSLWDCCFAAAERLGLRVNPVLPQYPDWLTGGGDDPEVRAAYARHLEPIVTRYRHSPALAFWTVDIEPTRDWRKDPSQATIDRFRAWLQAKYGSDEAFHQANPGIELPISQAYVVNAASEGPWNNFQPLVDWITFSTRAVADQVAFAAATVRRLDPGHPVSATPTEVLQNQPVRYGRDVWWIADEVDYPSCQLHVHWHLEMADMPADWLVAESASVRKVTCTGRGRPTYSGEVLAGPDLGEGERLWTPTGDELLATAACHLAEGAKGLFFWTWLPIQIGPNAGAWGLRELDGAPTDRSRATARFGQMVKAHGELLSRLRPEPAPIAILDLREAAAYLFRRSERQPMWLWFAHDQLGLYKALWRQSIPCDFVDEDAVLSGRIGCHPCLYVPFSMAMSDATGEALARYVEDGGTLIVSALTAFASPGHVPYPVLPGAGLAEVLGVRAQAFEPVNEPEALRDARGRESAIRTHILAQPVELRGAEALLTDTKGRALVTTHAYGKGRALWVGTMLGRSCRAANTPLATYRAVADLVTPNISASGWRIESEEDRLVCRHLIDGKDHVYVLVNLHDKHTSFVLDTGVTGVAHGLLGPGKPTWRRAGPGRIEGALPPRGVSVIHVRAVGEP